MIPDAAIRAGAAAIQSPKTPEECVLTAAVPHLTVEALIPDADLFGADA